MPAELEEPAAPSSGRRIGRLNDVWHPHIAHHPWTPRRVLLAAIAVVAMLVILVLVLTFVFSAGPH